MPGRRILIVLAVLVGALALVGAGCGGGDEGAAELPAAEPTEPGPPAEEPPAAEPPAEPPAEEPPAAEPPAEEPPTVASEVPLAADPGGQLAYDGNELNAFAGAVRIVLTNDSPVPHNVSIEDSGGNLIVEGEIFSGGGTSTTTATLEEGTYTFFCSVPGHRQAGMEGTLIVMNVPEELRP